MTGAPDDVVTPSRRDIRHVSRLAVACLVLLIVAIATRTFVSPTAAPRVHVRWAPAVSDEGRTAAERRFGLVGGAQSDGRTWAYDLVDTSPANVRALVDDPAVEDTHDIDRSAGTVAPTAPPGSIHVGDGIHRLRDPRLWTWTAAASATTLVVAALWLAGARRRRS